MVLSLVMVSILASQASCGLYMIDLESSESDYFGPVGIPPTRQRTLNKRFNLENAPASPFLGPAAPFQYAGESLKFNRPRIPANYFGQQKQHLKTSFGSKINEGPLRANRVSKNLEGISKDGSSNYGLEDLLAALEAENKVMGLNNLR
uniref:Uncharacterized protein n=1 Tax=Pseudodiaptomus poplesia TaxID=213370 RepID=A0A0U2IGD4_9MAXI|nr:hypothetical protein [Pseudodiaptomus poplesia]